MHSTINSSCARAPLIGWWQLVSCEVEYRDSGIRAPMYEYPAHGYIVFTPEGRMMTVIEVVRDNPSDPSREDSGFLGAAYTGRYFVNGSQWQTQVDAASIAGWTGSLQERSFRIESDRLFIISDWCLSPLHGGQTVRAWLVWKRSNS
jgi:hypothetical protein